ncbi:MAG: TAXI family TRAP transporter solute-binding subunit [Hyphomicrobiales bacterium]
MLQRLLLVALPAAAVLAIFYVVYILVDPLPPRRLVIGAGIAGSGYDNFARRYARVLARNDIGLEIRNTAGAVENLDLLRDPASKVQAALTTVGFAQPGDSDHLASLGGVFDAPIFVFYKSAERVTQFAQLRGKRLAIGTAGTSVRPLILQVLKAGGAADAPTRFVDMDYDRAIDALIAGEIDVAIFPSQLDTGLLRRALTAPDVRLMNVAQAAAIAKTVPGIKHVVLWQGLIDLTHDIPDADVNLLASGNSLLVRKDLHPALQYLLLEAIREVHLAPGPFNRLGEFPAEQPNDLPLSLTAQSFYRSGPTFWQRYTSFWLTSLLDRILFFVVPVVAALIPVIGFTSRLYRWLAVRRIVRLHRALGGLERELAQSEDKAQLAQHQARLSEIESAVRTLKVAPPFEVDLHRLRIHLRMVQDHIGRMAS